ncbi:hypothetical protein F5I97DRAFT_1809185 [Phlebopus sp. FC_14]|nr:hypothetical protein F5I97DRAFT_1809185 [Phlebopus sp. FC_14]
MPPQPPAKIWWSNVVFFVSVHIASVFGVYHRPPALVPRETLLMAFVLWQLADFGITIGYHRLYSHRSFRATLPVRIVLVVLGSSAFQGSIKWWCLRHRLHHRFTDDPVHDPYAATRGVLYSHMGWIFQRPRYERIDLIDREDLDNDPRVIRFQHRYYVPIALIFGCIIPAVLGWTWGDPVGAFIYGGLVTRLAVWHCTFLINSLAHWHGLQPYSDENTSRSNLLLALLTGGEGNHNFVRGSIFSWKCLTSHTFPYDYRSGTSKFDWDPSKWIIAGLHWLRLVTHVRRARSEDITEAREYMRQKEHDSTSMHENEDWCGVEWGMETVREYVRRNPGRCIVILEGFAVDLTDYSKDHPGGAKVLRQYALRNEPWRDASWAFSGGLNNHSRTAKRRMRELRVAKVRF